MGGKVAYGLVGGREWFKVDYPNSLNFSVLGQAALLMVK